MDETLRNARKHLAEEKEMPFATKSLMALLLLVISLLVDCLNLDSRNSSKPLSQDPNRKEKSKEKKDKNQGGQKHYAKQLPNITHFTEEKRVYIITS